MAFSDLTDNEMSRNIMAVLPTDLVDFIQSGVSIIVAVVGADGRAQTGRALAARVVAPDSIRLLYPAEGNAALGASAQAKGRIAVTFSAPLSHRTIQIKGVCGTAVVAAEDCDAAARQSAAFGGVLSGLGYTPAFVSAICAYRSSDMRALVFSIEAAFEQTPGPGAGRAL